MFEIKTLEQADVRRLADMLCERLARIGDGAVIPPGIDRLQAAVHDYAHQVQTLRVDIDMGGFILPLCANVHETHTDGVADLDRLAEAITARVADASRGRRVIVERIARARDAAESAAARIGATVLDVRIGRDQTDCRVRSREHWLEADIEMLDDALRPETTTFAGSGGRAFQTYIRAHARSQRRHRALAAKLGTGEIVHISAVAEAAIRFAGRSAGEVAAELLSAEKCGQWTQLSGAQWKDHVSVRLLDGLLVCSAMIPGVGYLDTMELWVDGILPDSIQAALRGRRLDSIADHPILQCDARITGSTTRDAARTEFAYRAANRAMTIDEIGTGPLRLAA